MGQHWSHLTPTKRIQLDAFIRAGMKPTDIAKELGVHHTTIYRELKRAPMSTSTATTPPRPDTTPKARRPAMRPTSAPRGRS